MTTMDQGGPSPTEMVIEALERLQALGSEGRFKEFWDAALGVEELFMTQREALGEQFQRFWGRYDRLCQQVRAQEAARQRAWQANAAQVEQEVQRLATQHRVPAEEGGGARYRFGPFWAHARDVQAMLEHLDLRDEDRARLSAWLEEVCRPVREVYERHREESRANREAVETAVEAALALAAAATDREGLMAARDRLHQALPLLRERSMMRDDRDAAWAAWREANGKLTLQGQALQDAAFARVQERVQQCMELAYRGNPYDAVQAIRTLQQDMGRLLLAREQREQVRQALNDAWERARVRMGELRVERQRRLQEREQRQAQWRQRMAANVERWLAEVQEAQAELAQVHKDIPGLQEELARASSPAYAQVLRRLVDEKRREIARLERHVQELQARVQDAQARLAQGPAQAQPEPST